MPFLKVPTSSINTSIAGARRFVAQSWPFARIRAVAKAYDATFNDTVLAICGGALRQYLINHAELPEESLKAMVPMNVRAEGDLDSSNAVASINADLGTNIADPASRLAAIQALAIPRMPLPTMATSYFSLNSFTDSIDSSMKGVT